MSSSLRASQKTDPRRSMGLPYSPHWGGFGGQCKHIFQSHGVYGDGQCCHRIPFFVNDVEDEHYHVKGYTVAGPWVKCLVFA